VWVMTLADGACSMGGCGGYELRKRTAAGAWEVITTDPAWYAHPQPDRLGFLGWPMFTDAAHGWISAGTGAGGGTGGVAHRGRGVRHARWPAVASGIVVCVRRKAPPSSRLPDIRYVTVGLRGEFEAAARR